MMEVYRIPSKKIQEIIFANATYEAVIEGLNGYFASEPRNDYITVKMESDGIKQDFVLYEAEAWADILIEWLRKKHGIFYYPGMEAKYAKSERIPPLTERLMDEGALNSLKKLHKRVTGKEPEVISHTLIADGILHAVSVKETQIEELKTQIKAKESGIEDAKEHITLLEADLKKRNAQIEELKTQIDLLQYDLWDSDTKDTMTYIRQEASRNGFNLPEEIDNEPLTVKRVFHDLLELLRMHETRIRNAERETRKAVNDQLKKDTDYTADALYDILEALGISKSDTVHLDIPRLKTKAIQRASVIKSEHDRYLEQLGKAAADYQALSEENQKLKNKVLETEDLLHKSVDSVNKECKATGKQMVDKYEKDLLRFIYKEYKGRTHLSDETVTYNPPSVRNTVLKIISDYARCRTRVDILETRIKSIFDRCKANFTVDDYVLNGDPTSSFMLDCISSWIDSPAESRGKTRAEIENYKLKLKNYILKDIKEHGYRYDGLQTKSLEEIVDWIITMATVDRANIALRDIYTTVASPAERHRYNIDDCNGENIDHMKDYILKRFEGLRINTEYCLIKMAELDGRQKDLKILEEQQEFLVKQNSELNTKVSAKDDEISRLKDLINIMNEEVRDM